MSAVRSCEDGFACAFEALLLRLDLTTELFFRFRHCWKYLLEFDILFLIFRIAAGIFRVAEKMRVFWAKSL